MQNLVSSLSRLCITKDQKLQERKSMLHACRKSGNLECDESVSRVTRHVTNEENHSFVSERPSLNYWEAKWLISLWEPFCIITCQVTRSKNVGRGMTQHSWLKGCSTVALTRTRIPLNYWCNGRVWLKPRVAGSQLSLCGKTFQLWLKIFTVGSTESSYDVDLLMVWTSIKDRVLVGGGFGIHSKVSWRCLYY